MNATTLRPRAASALKAAALAGACLLSGLAPAAAQEAAATVEMTADLKFVPENLTIEAGDTVTWRNVSDVPHTVTGDASKASDEAHVQLPEGAEPFDSGFIQKDETFSHTFEVPGEYTYFCIPHEGAGMVASLTVE